MEEIEIERVIGLQKTFYFRDSQVWGPDRGIHSCYQRKTDHYCWKKQPNQDHCGGARDS